MRRKSMQNGGGGGHRNNGTGGGRPRKFRSHGGGSGGGGGGGDFNSLARQKKNALTQKEKYLGMARDALTNGDRVEAEYYYQHVEHYSRVVGEIIAKEMARQPQEYQQQEYQQQEYAAAQETGFEEEYEEEDAAFADDAEGNRMVEEEKPAASRPVRTRTPRPARAANQNRKQDDIPLPASLFAETEDQAAGM